MRRSTIIAAIALAGGCTPTQGGVGSGDTGASGSGSGTDTGTSAGQTSLPPATTGDDTSATDDTADGTATEASATTTGDATSESSSGEPGCGRDDTDVRWAEDGTVDPPMELFDSDILGMPIAFSPSAGQGTLTLEIETQCDGPVYLWGLVWDSLPGREPNNPDSYWVTVDDGEEIAWEYGCHTDASAADSWTWVQVAVSNDVCDRSAFDLVLPAGPHTIVIRNREDGAGTNVAAIAGVVLSHDPATDPSVFLDPP